MTKKIHLCRMIDGKVIGNIQSINCDGRSILEAFKNKKSGEYLLFDEKLKQFGSFSDQGMNFENREIGEIIKETLDAMRTPEQQTVPLIKGEGMLVLMMKEYCRKSGIQWVMRKPLNSLRMFGAMMILLRISNRKLRFSKLCYVERLWYNILVQISIYRDKNL